ncbi:unnamed protein product [Bursaphelenchus xylophilus]|uniref:(pine wood nematode) hypothetical protein n=1 Tax=Bursaphelenchus xylophilus TaxID=6326 RepID=A0A1I7S3Z5_BURXY|nr:unnamed protein product [Bursaphelenchus xylophilus]CAG9116583.1 unnamed protein product [Bursaphelenchus xylophilus]
MFIYLLPFLLLLVINAQFNDNCNGENKTTYLRTEKVLTIEEPLLLLTDVTLNHCAMECTKNSNGVPCKTFEYNAQKQTCALKKNSAQPVGKAVLMPATNNGLALFQQICIPTNNLCVAPYSFERFPQKILTGHAMEVLSVKSLSQCLLECLESRERMHIDCKSVMYYYETGECIMNREQRKTAPHLFSSDTKFQLVDYFENNCFDVQCADGYKVHWIRMDDFEIGEDKDVIMGGLSSEECKQACTDNTVGSEIFPCKAFVYTSSKKECRLSAETGSLATGKKSSNGALISELSSISAGQYLEKFCLQGPVKCKDTSFDMIPNRMLEIRERVIITNSLSECLFQCLQLAEDCNSVMFFKDIDECVLNKKSQFSDPDLFKSAEKVDYFDNVCDYEVRPSKSNLSDDHKSFTDPPKMRPMFMPNMDVTVENTPFTLSGEATTAITSAEDVTMSTTPAKKKNGIIETDCRLDGIQIDAHFDEPSTGAIFIKDHSSTCRNTFEDARDARLEIPYPSSTNTNQVCPGIELAPSLWSYIVVVQKNSMGIPSLMTGQDRIFNVTCDYSNIVKNEKSARSTEISHDPPRPVFHMSPPAIPEKVVMSILKDGIPVNTVSLGEELELRWKISEELKKGVEGERLGFLVEECTAERLEGLPPDPAPLPLIVGGCPEKRVKGQLIKGPVEETSEGFSTKIKVFRFDGSKRVRIRCSINICVEKCDPINCDEAKPNSSLMSFGRKKRQTIKELASMIEQYDKIRGEAIQKKLLQGETIEQSMAQGSFTILDSPERQENEDNIITTPFPLTKSVVMSTISQAQTDQDVNEFSESLLNNTMECDAENSKICVKRSFAIALLMIITVLFASQMFTFFSWLQNRQSNLHLHSSSALSHSSASMSTHSTLSSGFRSRSSSNSNTLYYGK